MKIKFFELFVPKNYLFCITIMLFGLHSNFLFGNFPEKEGVYNKSSAKTLLQIAANQSLPYELRFEALSYLDESRQFEIILGDDYKAISKKSFAEIVLKESLPRELKVEVISYLGQKKEWGILCELLDDMVPEKGDRYDENTFSVLSALIRIKEPKSAECMLRVAERLNNYYDSIEPIAGEHVVLLDLVFKFCKSVDSSEKLEAATDSSNQ